MGTVSKGFAAQQMPITVVIPGLVPGIQRAGIMVTVCQIPFSLGFDPPRRAGASRRPVRFSAAISHPSPPFMLSSST
jgi:hypothetical protein